MKERNKMALENCNRCINNRRNRILIAVIELSIFQINKKGIFEMNLKAKKERLEEDVACYQMARIIKFLLVINLAELMAIIFLLW